MNSNLKAGSQIHALVVNAAQPENHRNAPGAEGAGLLDRGENVPYPMPLKKKKKAKEEEQDDE